MNTKLLASDFEKKDVRKNNMKGLLFIVSLSLFYFILSLVMPVQTMAASCRVCLGGCVASEIARSSACANCCCNNVVVCGGRYRCGTSCGGSCTDVDPSVPTLIAPTSGTQIRVGSTTNFSWNPVSSWGTNCDGNVNVYWACISSDQINCDLVNSKDITSTQTSWTPTVGDQNVTWSISANNGATGNNSAEVSFCVEAGPVYGAWGTCGASNKQTRTCTETCGNDDCVASTLEQDCGGGGQKLILDDEFGKSGMLSYGVPWTGLELGGNRLAKVSTPGWRIQSIYDSLRYDYNFYLTRMNIFASTDWDGDSISYDDNGKGYQIFMHTGNINPLNYDGPAVGEKVMLLVDGSVNINSDLLVPKGAFLAIIASGNITFEPTVKRAQGWFVAENINVPCKDVGSDGCDKNDDQFLGEGSFVGWTNISLTRDQGNLNNIQPSEKFTYRKDMVVNIPTPMKVYTRRFSPFIP